MAKSCTVEGCGALHYGKGMCKRHYMRRWNRSRRAKAYEHERRTDPARLRQERARNRRRRQYINDWLRIYRMGLHGQYVEWVEPSKVFERDDYRCGICGIKTEGDWPGQKAATVDHIIPLSRGGEHSYANVQCACWSCNLRKGSKMVGDQLLLG